MAQPRPLLRKAAAQKVQLLSPLKDKTLRNPGQSLDDEIIVVRNSYLDHLVVLVIAGTMLLITLLQWFLKIPPLIMVFVTGFFLACSVALYLPKMFRAISELRRLRRARDGERAVAEYLDLLRETGHRVFHDVVGTGFNIDHVIIGPKGIFTIETKTLNKHAGQNVPVRFDGRAVYVGNTALPDNPVPQALAQVTWLKRTLLESTGKTFAVRPVVVFPGWFVEAVHQSEVWVLEPKALRAFLAHEPVRLHPSDVSLAAFHLKRYIRATNP